MGFSKNPAGFLKNPAGISTLMVNFSQTVKLFYHVVLRSLDQFKGMLSLPKTGVAKKKTKKKKKKNGGCYYTFFIQIDIT